jgi:hypothetical protein
MNLLIFNIFPSFKKIANYLIRYSEQLYHCIKHVTRVLVQPANVFSVFLETRKNIKNQGIHEIKMLKPQYFQKNELYKMAIFDFFFLNN